MRRFSYVLEWAGIVVVVSMLVLRLPMLLAYFINVPNVLDYLPLQRGFMSGFILAFCSVQISLVLHNETLREAFRAHRQLLRRDFRRLAWFCLICGLNFFLILVIDAMVRSAIADRAAAMIVWKSIFVFCGLWLPAGSLLPGLFSSANAKAGGSRRRIGFVIERMKTSDAATEITRASKSNLAFAFIAMSGARRRDITTFYAFCRVIDDIADDNLRDPETKRRELARWRQSLRGEFANEPALARPVRQLILTYPITPEMLEEIITGVEMDVDIRRYATWDELRVYCHRVASAVGLVSIEIFGYRNPQCRDYAIALGLALQMTNIIRDVATDLKADRIYLPAQDLARFHYDEQDLRNHLADSRFTQLMNFEAARAEKFFADAARLLPPEDRRSMLPAEIMRSIYHALLRRMKVDNFRIFEKGYRLSKLEKSGRVTAQVLNCFLNLPRQVSV